MIINSNIIYRLLPHKPPFLLIDKVIEIIPGEMAIGIKNVTINEPYFCGHFPGEPIVPGVLLIESLAQLTAIMYTMEYLPKDIDFNNLNESTIDYKKISSKVGYLVDIKNVKFKKIVRPGDTIKLEVHKTIKLKNLSQIKIWAYVEGQEVVSGIISVSEKE